MRRRRRRSSTPNSTKGGERGLGVGNSIGCESLNKGFLTYSFLFRCNVTSFDRLWRTGFTGSTRNGPRNTYSTRVTVFPRYHKKGFRCWSSISTFFAVCLTLTLCSMSYEPVVKDFDSSSTLCPFVILWQCVVSPYLSVATQYTEPRIWSLSSTSLFGQFTFILDLVPSSKKIQLN